MILEPLSPLLNYFECHILAKGAESSIGIGTGERSYPLMRMPGWNRNSIGYHADDGKLYHENGSGIHFGPTCTEGDRMGCGVNFESDAGYGYCEVFFTKNGQLVGEPVRMKRPVYGLYPIIGLHSRGEKVRYLGHWHRHGPSLMEPMIQDHSPSNVWLRSNGILFRDDGLTLEYGGVGGDSQDVSVAQGRFPLDRTNYYFQLEIMSTGNLGAIAIGVGRASYPLHSHPGWSSGAVGYHADDGKLFVEQGQGKEFGPSCSEGDIMGCGIMFDVEEEEGAMEEEIKEEVKEESEDESSSDSIYSNDEDEDNLLDDNDDAEALFYHDLLQRERGVGGRLGRGGLGRLFPRRGRGALRGGRFGGFRQNRYNHRDMALLGNPSKSLSVSNSGSKCSVYFTKNGERIGDASVSMPKGGFFPLVGLLSKGEKVCVNLQPLSG